MKIESVKQLRNFFFQVGRYVKQLPTNTLNVFKYVVENIVPEVLLGTNQSHDANNE